MSGPSLTRSADEQGGLAASPGGELHAVADVSFNVLRGETLAIVGESGSGKSISSLALMGLLPASARVSGSARFNGAELLSMSERDMRRVRGRHMAMVFQDPMSSLNPVLTIGTQLEEPLRIHLGLNRIDARRRAESLLSQVGIPSAGRMLRAYPHEFSGGMRQRVMIAMALSCEPSLILADEPTTALDVSVQAQILELLRTVAAEHGSSLVMISHDLSVVAGMADRVAVMYAGEFAELGPSDGVFARPMHPYTRGLLESVARLDQPRTARLASIAGSPPDLRHPPTGCRFAPRCAYADRGCREHPVLEEREPRHLVACFERLPPLVPAAALGEAGAAAGSAAVDPAAPVAVRIDGLTVHFTKRSLVPGRASRVVRAVDDVSFDVLSGETLGIVGESGSGKSTTARAILVLTRPTRGTISLFDRRIDGLGQRELKGVRKQLQMVLQDPYSALDPRMTVQRIVSEPLLVHGLESRAGAGTRALELLELVGLPEALADRYPHQLSGGQRQRVNIARAIALRPAVIVADEPTSALDVSVRAQILNLMHDLQQELGLTYLFISHDLAVIRHMSDHVAVMYLGKIVELADRDAIYHSPQHPYTQALMAAVPVPDPILERRRRRAPLAGEIPSPDNPPPGCSFNTRCPFAFDRCFVEEPPLARSGPTHAVACHLVGSDRPIPEAVDHVSDREVDDGRR